MKKTIYISVVIIGCIISACLFIKEFCFCEKYPAVNKHPSKEPVTVLHSSQRGHALIGGSFKLIDQNGQNKSNTDFKGKYMIVYFGYSFCPDICPAALNNITQALKMMSYKHLKHLTPIFITIDPERDDSRNLQTYINNYHELFIALTGTKEQISKATKAYKVYAQKATPDGTSTDYLIDHSSIVYLMDRQGRFVTSFNHQTSAKEIVSILKRHIK